MSSDLDDFIQQHKAKLAQERENLQQIQQDTPPNQQRRTWQKTPNNSTNIYKENVPPKSPEEVGLIGKMTDSEARRKRLREERKNEYNQLLQQQHGRIPQADTSTPTAPPRTQQKDAYHATLPGLGNNDEAERRKVAERNREYNEYLRQPQVQPRNRAMSDTPQLEEFDQWSRDRPPPPPRKGWATPTYDEILNQKRQEERNYRQQMDRDFSNSGLGNADYKRNSVSDGQLNHAMDRRDNRQNNMDEDYDSRKVRFVGEDSSYPRTDPQPRRTQPRNLLEHSMQSDNLAALPPRSQRAQRNAEHFNATLLIGKELTDSDEKRRKAEYREELRRQIEESSTNKRRGHVGVVEPIPVEPENYSQQQQYNTRGPAQQTTVRQPQRGLPADLPSADDFGLRFGPSSAATYMPPVDSVLANGFNFDQYSRPAYPMSYPSSAHVGFAQPAVATNHALNMGSVASSSFVATPPVGPGLFRSPMDDAYYYYGLQNPLDPGLGTAPFIPAQQPVAQYRQSNPANSNGYRDYPEQQHHQQQQPASQRNAATAAGDPLRGLGEYEDRQAAAGDKKRMYQIELQKQIEEDNRRKAKAKEAKEAYEKKLEDEIRNYSPFGRGGAGAPMKDSNGNIITLRKGQSDQQKPPETSRRAPPAPVSDSANPWQYPDVTTVQYEPSRMQLSDHPELGAGDADFGHARGGNGIFGEPFSDEQKNSRMKYQDDLRKQIEERKRREKEEKDKAAREEELLMKRIEEENIRVKQQEAEEKQKAREKAAEAERKQQELLEHQERMRKEAEQKKREADETRSEQIRRQEERRRAEEPRRADSRMLNVQNDRVPESSQYQYGRNSRLGPSSSPAPRAVSNVPTSRTPSAEVMGHLARMKEQLRSERRRVESDLNRERMEPVVFDPRVAAQAAPATYDVDVVRVGPRRPTVTRHPLPDNSSRTDYSRKPKPHDTYRLNGSPDQSAHNDLEAQQRRQLAQQEEHLRQLRMDHGVLDPYVSEEPPGRHSRGLNNGDILESESDFIDVPPSSSRAEVRTDLDDLARQRNNNSRNRRRQRLESNPMGSLVSLNPEELEGRNQDRIRRLKSLAGDDISTGDPDSILQKFMSKVNHNRPPSSYTLEDDSWMNANTGR